MPTEETIMLLRRKTMGKPTEGPVVAGELELELEFVHRCSSLCNNRHGEYLTRFVSANGFRAPVVPRGGFASQDNLSTPPDKVSFTAE